MLGNAAVNAKLNRSLRLTIKEIAPILAVGMWRVVCFAANADGVKNVTIISTLRRTSSAALSNWRSGLPAAERISRRRLPPST